MEVLVKQIMWLELNLTFPNFTKAISNLSLNPIFR